MSQICENLQRRMLGHVMASVEEAQRLLGDLIAEGGTDRLTAEQQRLVFRVNQLLWPWLQALCRISNRRELRHVDHDLSKLIECWVLGGLQLEV